MPFQKEQRQQIAHQHQSIECILTDDFSHVHTERHHQDKPGLNRGLTYCSSSSVHVSLTLLIPQKTFWKSG